MGPTAGLDRCGKSRPPTGIRSPDRSARSESLYRESYRGRQTIDSVTAIAARSKGRLHSHKLYVPRLVPSDIALLCQLLASYITSYDSSKVELCSISIIDITYLFICVFVYFRPI